MDIAARAGKREAILEAASEALAASGFDGSSLRAIAAAAGVDPALLVYYYGSKEGLYRAVVDRRFGFVHDLRAALAASTPRAAASAWAGALRACSSGPDARACRSLLRSAGSGPASAPTGDAVEGLVAAIVGEHAGPGARRRAAHALSRLFGWLTLREILGERSLAGQTIEAAGADLAAALWQPPDDGTAPPYDEGAHG